MKHFAHQPTKIVASLALVTLLAACGGGGGGGSGSASGAPTPAPTPTIVLDQGFGQNGKVMINGLWTDTRTGYIKNIAMQPDGKVIAVTTGWLGGANAGPSVALLRFNANGSLDTTFGSNGVVETDYAADDVGLGVAIQADGKILAVGTNSRAPANFIVGRYNANGSLDTSFNGSGKVETDIETHSNGPVVSGSRDVAYAVAVQADGKIVVAGTTDNGTREFAVVRYAANGSLDASFGTGGVVTTTMGAGQADVAGIRVLADGKIAVAGSASDGLGKRNFALTRYNPDGSLDTTFGRVLWTTGGEDSELFAFDTLADGKVVATGRVGNRVAVSRFTSTGAVDSAFGNNGFTLTSIGSAAAVGRALGLQADGKILVAGSASNGQNLDFAMARYLADGRLDTGFGSQGSGLVTMDASFDDYAEAMLLQPDGKAVVAGHAHVAPYGNGGAPNPALIRVLP